jgi:hypothetical protein
VKPHMWVVVAGAVVFAGAISDRAEAQAGTLSGAVSGIVPVPVGPLVDNRDVGVGGSVALRYAPPMQSQFAVRLELAGLLPSSHDNGATDESTVVANGSTALSLMAGPEFDVAAPTGHFYTTMTAGADRVWSTSSASSGPTPAYGPFYTMTGQAATNFAWSGGGGYVTGRTSGGLAAELGVRYYDFGRVAYVTTYPGGRTLVGGANGVFPSSPYSTTSHHHMTFVAPSIGVSWRP